MKRSNRLVILVGVLLAVLAFVGIVVVLNGQTGTPPPGEKTTVTVLTAVEDIAIGDAVTPEMVTKTEVEPTAVVGTRLADPSQVGGRASLFNVPAGSQVTGETIGLGTNQLIDLTTALLPGERAIGFQVERVTGLDFLVQPGDHIDVILSQKINVLQPTVDAAADPDAPARFETIPGLEAAPTVKTVLQNRRVLYVSAQRVAQPVPVEGEEAAPTAQTPIENVIIIFAGSDQDAEVMKFVQNDLSIVGDLTAVVRSGEDDEAPDVETSGITLDILVEQFGVPIPNIVEQLQEGETP